MRSVVRVVDQRLRHALVLGWVLLVIVMALVLIWQVMWGGPPKARPDRAQV
jgi:hypothetical protein